MKTKFYNQIQNQKERGWKEQKKKLKIRKWNQWEFTMYIFWEWWKQVRHKIRNMSGYTKKQKKKLHTEETLANKKLHCKVQILIELHALQISFKSMLTNELQ